MVHFARASNSHCSKTADAVQNAAMPPTRPINIRPFEAGSLRCSEGGSKYPQRTAVSTTITDAIYTAADILLALMSLMSPASCYR